jgi:hypothetical protein
LAQRHEQQFDTARVITSGLLTIRSEPRRLWLAQHPSWIAAHFAGTRIKRRACTLAQDLGKRFPLDTQMQSLWLPAIQAQLALDRKNTAPAPNALQAASPIELGNIPFSNNIFCLCHVYVRGEAYLAAGQGSAAAEFQKILDHNGIVWNRWSASTLGSGPRQRSGVENRAGSGCRCRPRKSACRLQRLPHALEKMAIPTFLS